MSNTTKTLSERDYQQTLRHAYNDVDGSITSAGFLVGKVGRKITFTTSTTTVLNDTQEISFLENGITLYTLKLIYTDSSYATLISGERIA